MSSNHVWAYDRIQHGPMNCTHDCILPYGGVTTTSHYHAHAVGFEIDGVGAVAFTAHLVDDVDARQGGHPGPRPQQSGGKR